MPRARRRHDGRAPAALRRAARDLSRASLRRGVRRAPRPGARTARRRCRPTISRSCSSPRGRRRRPRASSSRIAISRRTSTRSADRRVSDRRRRIAPSAGCRCTTTWVWSAWRSARVYSGAVGGAADAAGVRQTAGGLAAGDLAVPRHRSASRRTLRTIWPCGASRNAISRAWICRAGASPVAARSRFTRQPSRRSPKSSDRSGSARPAFFPATASPSTCSRRRVAPRGRAPRIEHLAADDVTGRGVATTVASGDAGQVTVVSCGAAFPGHQIRIADEDGRALPERGIGEIRLAGPSVTPGYYNDDELTARTIRDGWLHTGDLGYLSQRRAVRLRPRERHHHRQRPEVPPSGSGVGHRRSGRHQARAGGRVRDRDAGEHRSHGHRRRAERHRARRCAHRRRFAGASSICAGCSSTTSCSCRRAPSRARRAARCSAPRSSAIRTRRPRGRGGRPDGSCTRDGQPHGPARQAEGHRGTASRSSRRIAPVPARRSSSACSARARSRSTASRR